MGTTRRDALATAAAAALPLVRIRTAGAAGGLGFGMWDHWVPEGSRAVEKVVKDWADKNKVDVTLDFLTSNGEKINITMTAEAQAGRGHGIHAFERWTVQKCNEKLLPVDNVVNGLVEQYGPVARTNEYPARIDGRWMAVPTSLGSTHRRRSARGSV